MKNLLALLMAGSALAACASPLNGPAQAISVAEQHPITVQQQVVTLSIAVDDSLSELSAVDKARIGAFADAWFTRGHGPVTITAPSGGNMDFYGQQVVAEIRNELYRLGMDYAAMQGASYRVPGDVSQPEILLTFDNYVASPSACGNWDDEYYRRSHNLRTKNFGCADRNNLAAMVADPRDLVTPQTLGAPDAARAGNVYQAYVRGEITSAEQDTHNGVSASE